MIRFELPFPAKELFPNYRSRTHHPRTRATKAAREQAYWTAVAANVPEGPAAIAVVMHPRDRRMDDDNVRAGFKAYRDGIADAMKVNDKRLAPTIEIGEPVKGGKVVVTVEAQG